MMTPIRICRLLVFLGAGMIILVKTWIRPVYTELPIPLEYLLGIFPNLLGSFLLTPGLFGFFNSRLPAGFRHYHAYTYPFWFLLLTINEYLQQIPVFGRTFDYNDILASAIGLSMAALWMSRQLFWELGATRETGRL